jgi:dolichol-phosphate mannosyltransferase
MLSLVLPTYNEADNLPELIPALETLLAGLPYEIIVVDDDSPDGTWRVALDLARQRDRVRVIRRVGRRGLSSAVVEGFLAAKGDVLAVADADGQHDLALLPKLYEAVLGGANVAVGSRYAEGGSVGDWDERRHLLSRIATGLAIRLCKVAVQDPMSGFFALDRATFEKALPRLNPKGFKILLDLLVHAPDGTRARELPFRFGARTRGESKLSRRVQIEFLEYLWDVVVGRFIPLELLKYCLVGAAGVVVNLAVYLLMARVLPPAPADLQGFSIALLVAIEAAIVFNFALNNVWTFRLARLSGRSALTGFLRYNLACLVGALANYGVAAFLYSRGFAPAGCVVAGAAVGASWNYSVNRLITWRT